MLFRRLFVEVVALISIYDNSYMIYSSQKSRVFHPEDIIPLFTPPYLFHIIMEFGIDKASGGLHKLRSNHFWC